MEDPISPRERGEIAQAAKLAEQYLYQCLSGRKDMKPKEAVRVERVSGGRLRRWHLRQSDWHETWPELIGAEGAPPVPHAAEASDAA
jgi:DNA-binding transcriptional regulator YdaS (Cro superfamily)